MSADPNTLIVTSLAVSGVLVVVKDASTGTMPPIRLAIGLTFAGVALATLAQFAPELAAAFALLLLASSVFVYGGPAIAAIGSTFTPPPTKGTP